MKNNREISYEVVRVVAICFVVGIHTNNCLPWDTPLHIFWHHLLNLFFVSCNGMFYMLSGQVALSEKCESLREYVWYYWKKFWGLIIPTILYMLLRYLYDTSCAFFDEGFMVGFCRNFSSNYSSYEYWYLYYLVGYILAAPFIGKALQNTSKIGLCIFIVLGLFFDAMKSYLPLFGYEWSWKYPLDGWCLYFCLGFCLDKIINSKKQKIVVIIVGGVCVIVSLIQSYLVGWGFNIHDIAPTMTSITCMIYIIIKSIKIKNNIIKSIISFIGKHSFGIYMVHIVILNKIVSIRPMGDNYYIEYLITTAGITLVISLVISFVFNTFLLFPLKKVMLQLPRSKMRTSVIEK